MRKASIVGTIILCTALPSPAQTVKIIDGIKTVINSGKGKWGDQQKVQIELNNTISKTDSDDENYLLYIPSDLARDDDGNVYVVDTGNSLVKKFDAYGKFILSFGGKGQGSFLIRTPSSSIRTKT